MSIFSELGESISGAAFRMAGAQPARKWDMASKAAYMMANHPGATGAAAAAVAGAAGYGALHTTRRGRMGAAAVAGGAGALLLSNQAMGAIRKVFR